MTEGAGYIERKDGPEVLAVNVCPSLERGSVVELVIVTDIISLY